MSQPSLCMKNSWFQQLDEHNSERKNWPQSSDQCDQCETCPLNRIKAGIEVRVKKLCVSPEDQRRLREIGFGEERIIRLLTDQTNYICQVCNARLAISRKLAGLILVEPLGPGQTLS